MNIEPMLKDLMKPMDVERMTQVESSVETVTVKSHECDFSVKYRFYPNGESEILGITSDGTDDLTDVLKTSVSDDIEQEIRYRVNDDPRARR